MRALTGTRPYRSPTRTHQARRTRARIVAAANGLLVEHGYPATTMRAVAQAAGVAVPTVELLFGTKPRLLQAVIDVAIAGDDEPVGVLDRHWAATARQAATARELLEVTAGVLRAAQERSASVVLAAYEAAAVDREIAGLVADQEQHRAVTARWVVDGVATRTPLRPELTPEEATESVWLLMDPAIFVRLVRRRGWPPERYQTWWAASVLHLLTKEGTA
ncbi:MAG: TetR/AcrR family transcriptional regulator [Lapillicoccus sp.]